MFKLLRRFAGPYRRELALGPLFKLVEVIFDLLTPLVIAHMIDAGVIAGDVSAVVGSTALLFAMALAGFGFSLVCQRMAARASQGVGTCLREGLYEHITSFSAREVALFGAPSLTTRLTNDINQIQLAVALAIRQLVRWPFLALGSLIAALALDFELGLIFLVAMPVVAAVFWLVMARCVPLFRAMQRKLDRVGAIVRENLSGARVVRAQVRAAAEQERFQAACDDHMQTAVRSVRLSSLLNPATLLVMDLAICAILWQGGIKIDAGVLSQGELIAFVNYMTQTLLSVVYVANLVVVFTRAAASAARVIEVLDTEPSLAEGPGAKAPSGSEDGLSLKLRQVGYRYPNAPVMALSGVTLSVPAGATLGVIGGTGSGKTTLAMLLCRLLDAGQGSVCADGVDVKAWPLADLRAAVSVVPQRASLVAGTIRGNLLWRNEQADDNELWRALTLAQARDFVEALPQGLDAPVEAAGRNFSGGQRQRLSIARALVGRPRLLVLDDAASALDLATDARLRRALSEVSCTKVIVSQRVAAVRDADVICVLSHGKPVGVGTHDELRARCEVYREICASQDTKGTVGA